MNGVRGTIFSMGRLGMCIDIGIGVQFKKEGKDLRAS